MHIPDGYLSPATCAALYACAGVGWRSSLVRLRKKLADRLIPRISVFAAFSFVLMMFNLPLPGGLTGHAVGAAAAALALGPEGAILAISLALTIQALFFGDGGLTTLGANCCNMAIVGSLTAWFSYKLLAGGPTSSTRRRIIAAAIAGYLSINLAALCAAVEFGLQPALFHDAAGAPLYAPYPLSIALPAMMIGHLTVAGAAEAIAAAGLVGWLLRRAPEQLAAHNDAPASASDKPLWSAILVLLFLTPLGLLAAGSAWGEWSANDFADPSARAAIAAGSGGHLTPSAAPSGLARLNELWHAPFADYAPSFVGNASLGYLFSALVGVGSLFLLALLWRRLADRRRGFLEATLEGMAEVFEAALEGERTAARRGLLQAFDPRARLLITLTLLVAMALCRTLPQLGSLFAAALMLALASRVALWPNLARLWTAALLFTSLVALPALFLTPGAAIVAWGPISLRQQGLHAALMLIARVGCAITLAASLTLSTRWMQLLAAMRSLGLPAEATAMLAMAHRYVYLLIEMARQMLESRRSRAVGRLNRSEQRRMAMAAAGELLGRSLEMSEQVHAAMLSRGFMGATPALELRRWRARDFVAIAGALAAAIALVWQGY